MLQQNELRHRDPRTMQKKWQNQLKIQHRETNLLTWLSGKGRTEGSVLIQITITEVFYLSHDLLWSLCSQNIICFDL